MLRYASCGTMDRLPLCLLKSSVFIIVVVVVVVIIIIIIIIIIMLVVHICVRYSSEIETLKANTHCGSPCYEYWNRNALVLHNSFSVHRAQTMPAVCCVCFLSKSTKLEPSGAERTKIKFLCFREIMQSFVERRLLQR
jgi:hypothetical protein